MIVLMINNRPGADESINTTSIGNKTWTEDRVDVMKNAFTIDYKNATPLIIESAEPVNIPAGYGLVGYAEPCEDVQYAWGGEYFPVVETEGWGHDEVGCDCVLAESGKGCYRDTPFVGGWATISMVILVAFSQSRRLD